MTSDSLAARQLEICRGLTDILAVLNSDRTLFEMLDYLAERAAQTLEADATAIFRFSRTDWSATLQAQHRLPAVLAATGIMPVAYGDGRGAAEVLRLRQPFPVVDLTARAREVVANGTLPTTPANLVWAEWMPRYFSSLLSVPLVTRAGLYGGLTFYFSARRELSEDDLRVGMALGDQVALAIENAQLRADAAEHATAAERSRLARDLHDAVTQTLFSATLVADVLPRLWKRDPDSVPDRLEQLRRLTRGALAEMRTLLVELRPAVLTEAPLGQLLRYLAEAATGQSDIPIVLDIVGEARLPPDVQVALYRIAQEALNNVTKHSGATHVEIRLSQTPEATRLSLHDDGRGFDPASVPGGHLGLAIMQERATAAGVWVRVSSSPGQGTEIAAGWPARPFEDGEGE